MRVFFKTLPVEVFVSQRRKVISVVVVQQSLARIKFSAVHFLALSTGWRCIVQERPQQSSLLVVTSEALKPKYFLCSAKDPVLFEVESRSVGAVSIILISVFVKVQRLVESVLRLSFEYVTRFLQLNS